MKSTWGGVGRQINVEAVNIEVGVSDTWGWCGGDIVQSSSSSSYIAFRHFPSLPRYVCPRPLWPLLSTSLLPFPIHLLYSPLVSLSVFPTLPSLSLRHVSLHAPIMGNRVFSQPDQHTCPHGPSIQCYVVRTQQDGEGRALLL